MQELREFLGPCISPEHKVKTKEPGLRSADGIWKSRLGRAGLGMKAGT